MNEEQINTLSYAANQLEYVLGRMQTFTEYQSDIAGLRDDYNIVSEPYHNEIEESSAEAVRHLRDICEHLITSAQIHVENIKNLIARTQQEK